MSLVDNESAVVDQQLSQQHKSGHKGLDYSTVHKFGGSSLRDATAIELVVSVIKRDCGPNDLVVLSAMGKTTDLLIELVEQYKLKHKGREVVPDYSLLTNYQRAIITDVLSTNKAKLLLCELENDLQRIEFLLSHIGDEQFNDADIIGYGELWSTRLMCAVLADRGINCVRVDPREFIYIADIKDELQPNSESLINWPKSQEMFDQCKHEFNNSIAVICGFIASDSQGKTVTLGRNGSDFSATIIAKLCGAKMVNLWTDVDGVFSGDPNLISDTKVIPQLGLNEAHALANLGTSVFHEKTLKPLQDSKIPVRIRNSRAALEEQNSNGTLISVEDTLAENVDYFGAKTIAFKSFVCLFRIKWREDSLKAQLNIELRRLLQQHQLSFYCWSEQEETLSFCTKHQEHMQVAKLLTRQEAGEGCEFSVQKDLSIISLVGGDLLNHGEHLAKFYTLIESSGQSVYLYHYDNNGAISVILDDENPLSLVKEIHSEIFTDKLVSADVQQQQLNLVLIGCGNIGRKLLEILHNRLELINSRAKQKIVVVAACNSRHFVFDAGGLDLSQVAEDLTKQADKQVDTPSSVSYLEEHLEGVKQGRICIVDVTASFDVCNDYSRHFTLGRNIISASKLALTMPSEQYEQLKSLCVSNNCQWLSNVSCGAGLPIQKCINDLYIAGDQLKSIEGVFSGSLSWILKNYDGKKKFTQIVKEAKELGLTEPDPRDDLSGKDVQRKLLIIARTLGLKLNLEDIELSPLIPESYFNLTEQQYAASSDDIDLFMQEKWQHADQQGLELCYCGELTFDTLDNELNLLEANVGLSFRRTNDALVGIEAADNIVVIRSLWHNKNPLVIRGPGAGIEITAAGIVSDLIHLSS